MALLLFLLVVAVYSQSSATNTTTVGSGITNITIIRNSLTRDVVSFQVSTKANSVSIIYAASTTCAQASADSYILSQPASSSISGGEAVITLAARPADCLGANLTVTVIYPESVRFICSMEAKGLYCADSYYRSITPESPFDYKKDDVNGVVYDVLQGLLWTKSPLPQAFTNPNCCGAGPNGDQPMVDAAKVACKAFSAGAQYSGYTFRLPTRSEIHRLMDHKITKTAINRNFFSLPSNVTMFWTSDRSPVQDYILNAYAIAAGDGGIYYNGDVGYASSRQDAMCVTSVIRKLRPLGGQYVVSPSKLSVHDSYTGLDWTRNFSATVYPGPGITSQLAYCEGLTIDGFTDWRLPTIKELVSLHSDFERGPLWNHTVFQIGAGTTDWWWSSTPHRGLTGYFWAWEAGGGVAFINVSPGKARCVRGTAHSPDARFAPPPAPFAPFTPPVAVPTTAPVPGATPVAVPVVAPVPVAVPVVAPVPVATPTTAPSVAAPVNAPTTSPVVVPVETPDVPSPDTPAPVNPPEDVGPPQDGVAEEEGSKAWIAAAVIVPLFVVAVLAGLAYYFMVVKSTPERF